MDPEGSRGRCRRWDSRGAAGASAPSAGSAVCQREFGKGVAPPLINEIQNRHGVPVFPVWIHDWLPTFLSARGRPVVVAVCTFIFALIAVVP